MREGVESASVDTNIGATVDISNLEDFDGSNVAPIICLAVVYGIYAVGLVFLIK